jgi:hypothetical protein
MSRLSLPCIKCGKPLRNVDEGTDNQPAGGTEFVTYGHYGSTIHDEIGEGPRMALVVNFCDTCILRAIEAGVVQSRSEDGSILLANHHLERKEKAWVLAQNEKMYGSAWGDDEPQDYRALMLEAGWPEDMLDKEERDELNLNPVTVPKQMLPGGANGS